MISMCFTGCGSKENPAAEQRQDMDGEEILKYKTNPLEAGTDGDGAGDEWEILNGFDANTKDDLFHIEGNRVR